MKKTNIIIALLIAILMVLAFIPFNIVNAAITDVPEGASTNSKTTLVKTETGTEEVASNVDLVEYITSKKTEYLENLPTDSEFREAWAALYVAEYGEYKYPQYLATVFTGVTTSGGIIVGDPEDLTGIDNIATYNYEVRYKEITVTKATTKIESANVTLKAPKIGDEVKKVTINDEYGDYDSQSLFPTVSTTTEGLNVNAFWVKGLEELSEESFYGTFEADTYYYALIDFEAKDGYELPSTFPDGIKINGVAPDEIFAVYGGKYTHCIAKIKASNTTEYNVLEGANQTVNVSKKQELKFRFNIDYAKFLESGKVYVDDKLVDNKNYTSKEGSTIITFNQAYTNTLSAGQHTVRVAVADGEVSTNFTITRLANPVTGDNIGVYVTLLAIATIGFVFVKRKNK